MAVAEVLDALADKNRRNILLKLKEGKISSGDLAIALGMTPQSHRDRYNGSFTVPVVFNLFFLSYIIFCTW